MRVVVKIGGAQLEESRARRSLASSVAAARERGHELVLVHGGGNQIRELTRRLGIEDRYYEGLRITDADTAEAALCVLGGQVNRTLVRSLEDVGVRAVGLTGADGGTFQARPMTCGEVELGYVGEVARVRTRLLERLLAGGYVPVLATVAPRERSDEGGDPAEEDSEPFYNVNADAVAGPLGRALGADAVLFLTDVAGVTDETGAIIDHMTPEDGEALTKVGVIQGGMVPKVRAALSALEANPRARVVIASAEGDGALLAALEGSVGTRFLPSPHLEASRG